MPTKVPLQSTALNTATSSVTFSGLDQGYTDLEIVVNGGLTTTAQSFRFQFNGDTATNYSYTYLAGNGSSASSASVANASGINAYSVAGQSDTLLKNGVILQLFNYSNTVKNKTCLLKGFADAEVAATVGMYRISSPSITSVTVLTTNGNLQAGTTIDLYGISPVNAKITSASGGTAIYYDSTYAYHVFTGTGAFVPNRALTADILVVAGGGGAQELGGGGGAGGLLAFTSQSLSASTSYNVLVGSGGIGGYNGTGSVGGSGTNSQFGALTAVVGGGGGGRYDTAGGNGGSGGGAGRNYLTAATGTAGQGNNGGIGLSGYQNSAAGGGGAGAVGSNAVNGAGGAGGVGGTSTFINAIGTATGFGQLVSSNYYFAGGGGGGYLDTGGTGGAGGYGGGATGASGTTAVAPSGATNTGGGGGGGKGGNGYGGNGGSGIVIVRYVR